MRTKEWTKTERYSHRISEARLDRKQRRGFYFFALHLSFSVRVRVWRARSCDDSLSMDVHKEDSTRQRVIHVKLFLQSPEVAQIRQKDNGANGTNKLAQSLLKNGEIRR